jgi:rod shape determining protein RodA
MARTIQSRLRDEFDWPLFLLVATLATIGVVNLYSATSAQGGVRGELYIQQIYWLAVGSGVAVIVAAIDYKYYERYAYGAYIASVVALVAVFLLGRSVRGTHRWIHIGSFVFQPSEFVKICVVLALAKHLQNDARAERRTIRDLLIPGFLIALPLGLIMAQPDLGTGLILLLIGLTVVALARMERRSFVILAATAGFLVPVIWQYALKDYQRLRLTSFLEAEKHRLDTAYQATQSIIAIGSGGVTGQGFMRGTQNQRRFLPDPFTDFPLAVWAQEQGLLGNLVVISLYVALVLWALRIGSLAKDRFGAAVSVGIAGLFFWHVVFNIGMVIGVLPVVGVTLPLFSYGGSSVLTILIGVGLLMNISIRRQTF